MKTIYDPRYVSLISLLRANRISLGITQGHLARRMGVSRTLVVRVEQHERRLDVLELYCWLGVLGLKMAAVETILAGERR